MIVFLIEMQYHSLARKSIFSPGTGLKERIWGQGREWVQLALLVSLTMSIELEGHMIPQKDTLGETNILSHPKKLILPNVFWMA